LLGESLHPRKLTLGLAQSLASLALRRARGFKRTLFQPDTRVEVGIDETQENLSRPHAVAFLDAKFGDASPDFRTQRRPAVGLDRPRLAVADCFGDRPPCGAEDRDLDGIGAEKR